MFFFVFDDELGLKKFKYRGKEKFDGTSYNFFWDLQLLLSAWEYLDQRLASFLDLFALCCMPIYRRNRKSHPPILDGLARGGSVNIFSVCYFCSSLKIRDLSFLFLCWRIFLVLRFEFSWVFWIFEFLNLEFLNFRFLKFLKH